MCFLVMCSFLSAGLPFFISHPRKPKVLNPTSSLPLDNLLRCEWCLEQESWRYLGDSYVRLVKSWLFPCPCQSWIWHRHQKILFVKTPCTLCLVHCTAMWQGSTPRRWKKPVKANTTTQSPCISITVISFAEQCLARKLWSRFFKFRIELEVIESWNIYSMKVIQKCKPWEQKSCIHKG